MYKRLLGVVDHPFLLHAVVQHFVHEGVVLKRSYVTNKNKLALCARQQHVQTAPILQQLTHLAVGIAPHEAHKDTGLVFTLSLIDRKDLWRSRTATRSPRFVRPERVLK